MKDKPLGIAELGKLYELLQAYRADISEEYEGELATTDNMIDLVGDDLRYRLDQ